MYEMSYQVGLGELEALYLHVNHARTISLLEKARLGMLEQIGFPNQELISLGYAPVITRLEVDYKREIRQGDIRLTCERARIEGKELRLTQRAYNERGKEAVLAEVSLKFLSTSLKRAVEPPPEFSRALEAFFGAPGQA